MRRGGIALTPRPHPWCDSLKRCPIKKRKRPAGSSRFARHDHSAKQWKNRLFCVGRGGTAETKLGVAPSKIMQTKNWKHHRIPLILKRRNVYSNIKKSKILTSSSHSVRCFCPCSMSQCQGWRRHERSRKNRKKRSPHVYIQKTVKNVERHGDMITQKVDSIVERWKKITCKKRGMWARWDWGSGETCLFGWGKEFARGVHKGRDVKEYSRRKWMQASKTNKVA